MRFYLKCAAFVGLFLLLSAVSCQVRSCHRLSQLEAIPHKTPEIEREIQETWERLWFTFPAYEKMKRSTTQPTSQPA
jgi:hypothetical protein